MVKSCHLLISISILFLLFSYALPAQVSVNSVEIHSNVELVSESLKGQAGILVLVDGVEVRGYKDRLLTFTLAITDMGGKKVLSDYYNRQIGDEIFLWNRISFEAGFESLRRVFGEGSHQLLVVFNIYTMDNTDVELIPGAYHVRELKIELGRKDGPGKLEIDKEYNTRVLQRKGEDGPVFEELLSYVRNTTCFSL